MLITQSDLDDYQTGFALGRGGSAFPDGGPWWAEEGWNQAVARWAAIPLIVGSVPPTFKPWTVLRASEVRDYLLGYSGAAAPTPRDSQNWWYRVGTWDRAQGKPQRPVQQDLPAPAFNEVTPTAPPPVANQQPGQPAPAVIFAEPLYQLQLVDLRNYEAGWLASARGQSPPASPFWAREGFASRGVGRVQVLPSGNVFWGGLAPLDAADVQSYKQGFARLGDVTAALPDLGTLPYWYRQGLGDLNTGRGDQGYVAGQKPVGFPVVINRNVVSNPPGRPPVTGTIKGPFFELLATIFGKPVPYDSAARVGQALQPGLVSAILSFGTKFEFLGDAPGSQREGYRLSGPRGPLAQKIARLVDRGVVFPDPRRYRLPAWVGAHLSNGEIKLLGRGELQSIGLWDQLLDSVGQRISF